MAVDLIRAREFVHAMSAQLAEARAVIRALDALKTVSGAGAATEALEARLREALADFPGAPDCLLSVAPAPVCVCHAQAPDGTDCICGALHPDGPALNLAEKARRGRLLATDVFGDAPAPCCVCNNPGCTIGPKRS